MAAEDFEFIEDGPIKQTVADAYEDAIYVLENVTTNNPHGLSRDAFNWGMEGRRVSPDASRFVLSYLVQTGVISFNYLGSIEYPPVKPE